MPNFGQDVLLHAYVSLDDGDTLGNQTLIAAPGANKRLIITKVLVAKNAATSKYNIGLKSDTTNFFKIIAGA
jgi:hypothetical protein